MSDDSVVDDRQANKLFTQGVQSSHAQSGVTPMFDVSADLGLDIPVDCVPVPSRGMCYAQCTQVAGVTEV